jgi:hypothetical protein
MPIRPPSSNIRLVQVVLGTTTLRLFPSGTGMATGLIELGVIAFFSAGVAEQSFGMAAPWVVLAAVLLGLALRAADLEGCALFIP